MEPSARQLELERIYEARKGSRGHVPQISISDDTHHVTEAIGSYYGDEPHHAPLNPPPHAPAGAMRDPRPLSYMNTPSEVYEPTRGSKRGGGYFGGGSAAEVGNHGGAGRTRAHEPTASGSGAGSPGSPAEEGSLSPKSIKRMGSLDTENRPGTSQGQASPPSLSRHNSTEAAMQQFPLNDIDYESSPAAVAQELSNLQAIRRMSMNVDAADPDLPSFGGVVPTVAPTASEDEEDPSRLFWVPARLHPELAPKEFKTFIEDRVDKIRRRSGDSDTLSVDGLERSSSGSSSLRRKKSMLSHQIDTTKPGSYEDGAERLERKRSKGVRVEAQATVANLSELETLVNDPTQLIRRMSLDPARRSQDSGVEVPPGEDMPILPPVGQSLKRSTRTNYRRGSLKKGERVPFSKRAKQRHADSETDESPAASPTTYSPDEREPILGLTRVQTEPPPAPTGQSQDSYVNGCRTGSRRKAGFGASQSTDDLVRDRPELQPPQPPAADIKVSPLPPEQQTGEHARRPSHSQPRQFQSRLASGGRTTAQLPGYNNTNPLPHIIETLPDGSKVPVGSLAQQAQSFPERKSSHEIPRSIQRGGAHMRPAPGRQQATPSSTLDDISSNPSPLPGSGSTRTDALTMVPTFDDKKVEKKDSSRKSSWKWILGSDDDDKEKKAAKEERALDAGLSKLKASKLSKNQDKARLDVLQNSIEGVTPARGRESLVLNRADVLVDDERKKESKKTSEPKKEKDSGLLSAIFGGKKKTSDGDLKEKKRKADRRISPDPPPRILKPDIDYNWTRFSILEERAIYRMAHIKLANPRRALYSQVLLSNFMYSYLAKVQMMHPMQQQMTAAQQKAQQKQQEQQPAEYSQYQRWQQQQDRQEQQQDPSRDSRTSFEMVQAGVQEAGGQGWDDRSYDEDGHSGYDSRENYESYDSQYSSQSDPARVNGILGQPVDRPSRNSGGYNHGNGGYSVASTHDYLGYPKDQQPFGQDSLWDDERKEDGGDLW
ncbi:hypothetical protein EJ03DRAFT_324783 [Teratosphaeria nubilosa]|uniref:Protein Zds1 C-terminal domain-containing protein n=1 Tax=Teratosphaeria nubilosa TaxID=161662 RepID=A0A6G1LHI7_9PEZI|nr:hypothetical protein EJ03DRAFT_324783 [Teratosphaeria nubilosa]